ncbi:hypothetical protein AA313_de0207039 [Arthrobotrys entomopaga]|nr:hypothetical protein AA313_de0207039 [Arthrobotrys entomopaga]
MSAPDLPIVLYHYVFSPVARRIVWYLNLRNIPYSQCMQPNILPRPDVALLGIAYRRIPILSIGRDVYLDSRLIISKLEQLYPPSPSHPSISATTGDQKAIERLLEFFMMDGGIFRAAGTSLPPTLPIMKDPAFLKDRAEFAGVALTGVGKPGIEKAARRPTNLSEVRDAIALLESSVLADGREWVLGTPGPMLADIEAIWVIKWIAAVPGGLPEEIINAKIFPRVYAWMERFTKVVDAKEREHAPEKVKGEQAAEKIFGAAFAEAEGTVDELEIMGKALGLSKGDEVTVFPTDTGVNHKEKGKLLSLDAKEMVIEVQGGKGSVRVHAPRHGFAISKIAEKASL